MARRNPSRRSFLKTSTALVGISPLTGVLPRTTQGTAAGPLIAYVGTFSSPLRDVLPTQVDLPPGNGRGIHLFRVDRATGAMTPAGVHEMGTSPSCLAVNAAGTRLYSANETDRVGDDKEGTVSAFAIDRADGKLKLLNTVRSGGAGPTYVSVHPSGRFLLVANYFGGSVAVLPILADGRLGDATDVKNDAGKIGPDQGDQRPAGQLRLQRARPDARPHDPGRPVRAVRAARRPGPGQDLRLEVRRAEGRADPERPAVGRRCRPGDGPRHFHFHPNGRWLYSIQEEGSTVVLFDYDAATGRLTPRQTISTLPPGFAGSNFCSEILVSADGRFVYAGNRLHDSIGIFSVGPDGELTYVGEEWTRGNYPRSFSFDPTGQFLYCCNQRGDNVAVFRVDRKTGGLDFHRPLHARRQPVDHRLPRPREDGWGLLAVIPARCTSFPFDNRKERNIRFPGRSKGAMWPKKEETSCRARSTCWCSRRCSSNRCTGGGLRNVSSSGQSAYCSWDKARSIPPSTGSSVSA